MTQLIIEDNARDWISKNSQPAPNSTRTLVLTFGSFWKYNGRDGYNGMNWIVEWNKKTGDLYAYQLTRNAFIRLDNFSAVTHLINALGDWNNPKTSYYRNLQSLAEHLQGLHKEAALPSPLFDQAQIL
jgi:hypothetical protein